MALTRKLLKGMGLTEEQVDTIIEAHTETVNGLQKEINLYKPDAEKLAGVQKDLDDLRAAKDGGYKEKYEKEHKDFDDFKNAQTARETKAAKETAFKALLKGAGIDEKRIPAIVRVTDLGDKELVDGKFKDEAAMTEAAKTDWADFVVNTNTGGAPTHNPPKNDPAPVAPKTIAEALRESMKTN